jgi:hypothetical protein
VKDPFEEKTENLFLKLIAVIIGDSIQVTGYKFTFDSRPKISGYLQPAYSHDLPVLIDEAPSGVPLKGYGIILIGIVIVVVPLRMMYTKFIES